MNAHCQYADVIAQCTHEWVYGGMVVSTMDLINTDAVCQYCDVINNRGDLTCPECHQIHAVMDLWDGGYITDPDRLCGKCGSGDLVITGRAPAHPERPGWTDCQRCGHRTFNTREK
jgi:hypothetical protein